MYPRRVDQSADVLVAKPPLLAKVIRQFQEQFPAKDLVTVHVRYVLELGTHWNQSLELPTWLLRNVYSLNVISLTQPVAPGGGGELDDVQRSPENGFLRQGVHPGDIRALAVNLLKHSRQFIVWMVFEYEIWSVREAMNSRHNAHQ